ncbi:Thoeris anti-defense Tad2 family protein [Lacrimispora sp.]|uniref:Thoeris anti-defense Tad2 family protein n=1 Tax=Lacrimispora sp. TaxID=2719234 RepID=UPI00285A75D1|nr:MW1434 family type I TA system toxin [Lacrimispora sp.]MDR7814526.1 DUF2829 domain-containing protein [Lacrimispora sp.]
MFIHEAVKEAMSRGEPIRRKEWAIFGWWILLTEPIMAFTKRKRKDGYCWNPQPKDLMADDWEVAE